MTRARLSIDAANQLVEERLMRSSVRAESHERLDRIESRLQIAPFEKLMLFLAKADVWALQLCTDTSRKNLAGLGAIVLFTGTVAFFSAWYTFSAMVFPHDSNNQIAGLSILFGAVLAAVYASGIMIIDREIVSAISGNVSMILGRLAFAIIVSFAISYPVKLLIFDGKIQEELRASIKETNAPQLQKARDLEAKHESGIAKMIADVDARNATLARSIKLDEQVVKDETERGGCRGHCRAAQQRIRDANAEIKANDTEKAKVRAGNPMSEHDQQTIKEAENLEHNLLPISQDLLSKSVAFERLQKKESAKGNDSVGYQSWFVLLFFVALELMPVLIKLSLSKSEYQYYLEARQNLNSQKIVSVTNFYMEAMQDIDAPGNVLKVPAEVTEWMHASMEDERVPYRAPSDRDPGEERRASVDEPTKNDSPPNADSLHVAESADENVPGTPVRLSDVDLTTDEPRT